MLVQVKLLYSSNKSNTSITYSTLNYRNNQTYYRIQAILLTSYLIDYLILLNIYLAVTLITLYCPGFGNVATIFFIT